MIDTVLNIIKWGWIAYLGYSGVRYVVKHREWIDSYRQIKWRLYVHILPMICLVLGFMLFLFYINAPVFQFSWFSLVGSLLGRDIKGGNISMVGLTIPFIGVVLCLLLLAQLSSFSRSEELLFRKGTKSWRGAVVRSIAFGLAHMIVGVPFGTGIALILSGLYFSYLYFKGGVDLSAQAHFQYNLFIVSLVLLVSIAITITFLMGISI